MAIDFKLPNLGENIDSGDVINVLVKEGDVVKANQGIIEVETGKATVEIPSPSAGTISKLFVKAGGTIKVGGTIATIEASAGGAPAAKPAAPAPKPEAAPAPKAEAPKPAPAEAKQAEVKTPETKPSPVTDPAPAPAAAEEDHEGTAAPAGPATRRLARELGVDLARVEGTGPGGRITRDDIIASVRKSTSAPVKAAGTTKSGAKPAAGGEGTPSEDKHGPIRTQPMSRTRKAIVGAMTASLTIPALTNFDDADITELDRMRKGSSEAKGAGKLTMLPFVMKAVAMALKAHPNLNASLDLKNETIIYKDYVNLGCAIDTERGLVVPVIKDVDQLSIPAISGAVAEIAEKAKVNKLGQADVSGATFTISNLGAIGGTYSTPIISQPEVAILLLGRSRYMPVVVNDKIEIRLMMPLSLSYDHRLIDGATAARFLNEVKNYLQVPGRLLLAS
ncbi:MAG: 2-oxo acid dehydrogenase subunit E2 [Planctomycetia bacterium]|nr:2-oxo acid dehydrogenase subunit E2 [Planctomycetia bacterium]